MIQNNWNKCWEVELYTCETFSLTFSKAIGFYATNCDSGVAVCEFALVMVIFFLFALFAVEFRHIECRILIMKKHILKDEKSLESVKVNVSVVELFKWTHIRFLEKRDTNNQSWFKLLIYTLKLQLFLFLLHLHFLDEFPYA